MAESSLNEFSSLINQQMQFQDMLSECLSKAESLTDIALSRDFLEHDKRVIHDYLLILNDIICQTREINKNSIHHIRQNKAFINSRVS